MEIFSKAQRIWSADADGTNVYADFFAEFPRADRITLACDGNYALYINGDFVAHVRRRRWRRACTRWCRSVRSRCSRGSSWSVR